MKKTFMALALTLLPFGMASAQVRMLVVPKLSLIHISEPTRPY